jgi:hypothetical protein
MVGSASRALWYRVTSSSVGSEIVMDRRTFLGASIGGLAGEPWDYTALIAAFGR